MIEIKQEFLSLIRPEIEPLTKNHWSETESFKEELPVDVDWDMLESLEQAGVLYVFVARVDGFVAGYLSFVKGTHFNYKGATFANDVGFFVDAPYRKFGLGVKLMKFAESVLKNDGIKLVNIHTKVDTPIDSLMIRQGYKQEEKVFTKVLKER